MTVKILKVIYGLVFYYYFAAALPYTSKTSRAGLSVVFFLGFPLRLHSSHLLLSFFSLFLGRPESLGNNFGNQINELWDKFGAESNHLESLPDHIKEYFDEEGSDQNDQPDHQIDESEKADSSPVPGSLFFQIFQKLFVVTVIETILVLVVCFSSSLLLSYIVTIIEYVGALILTRKSIWFCI